MFVAAFVSAACSATVCSRVCSVLACQKRPHLLVKADASGLVLRYAVDSKMNVLCLAVRQRKNKKVEMPPLGDFNDKL